MTHPAILKSQEIWDRPGDLDESQNALIASVNRITQRKAHAYGAAKVVWGDLPKMYRSCLIAADERCNADLSYALEQFELSLEDQDALDEIEFATAE